MMHSERLASFGRAEIGGAPTVSKSVAVESMNPLTEAETIDPRETGAGGSSVPQDPADANGADAHGIDPVVSPLNDADVSSGDTTSPDLVSTRALKLSHRIKLAVVGWDALSFAAAAFLSLIVLEDEAGTWGSYPSVLVLLCVIVLLAAFGQQSLYNSRHVSRRSEELRRMVNAAALGTVCVAALPLVIRFDPRPHALLILFVLTLVFSGLGREVVRRVIRSQRISGKISRRVVLVGNNREARELHEMLEGSSELGYQVVGRVSDSVSISEQLELDFNSVIDDGSGLMAETPWLGTTDRILEIVKENGANGVVVATTDIDLQTANRLVRSLTNEGMYVEMSAAMRDIAARRISIRPLGRYPIMSVEPSEAHGWHAVFKRCFDVIGSALILLGLLPVMITALIAIRVTSGPGVIFRQTRVGRKGKLFTVYKLRTMVHDAESLLPDLLDQNEAAGPMFKMTDDPRVTSIGKFLRKTSLDEVPQFVNVIKGDMSLVGPRPALPDEAEQWSDELRERLRVKPGITGNWQINGRFTSSIEDYQRLDLFYVDNWSLVTDLVIMAKTIPAVLKRNGAA